MQAFKIESVRWSGDIGHEVSECVVADNINQVIDYLKVDLQDAAVEIEAIYTIAPVTKILCNQ